jgi:hypothetical protein
MYINEDNCHSLISDLAITANIACIDIVINEGENPIIQ